jgi:hypothetical protein
MDLFLYNLTYHIWICTASRCQYTVPPQALLAHLRAHHPSHATASSYNACQEALAQMLKQPWIDPSREPGLFPPPGGPPMPGLPVYQGRGCPHCPYIGRTTSTMEKHRRVNHKDKDGHWSPGWLSRAQARARAQQRLVDRVVHCQRFYHVGTGSHFFKVTPLPARNRQALPIAPLLTPTELIRARVDQALRAGEAATEVEDGQVPALATHPTKVSPWLELTRWPEYLRGQDLTMVALLGCPIHRLR